MITLFNRVISLISIVGVLLTSFALINVLLQFSWLALLILMLAMLMVFLILKQENHPHSAATRPSDPSRCRHVGKGNFKIWISAWKFQKFR